MKSEETREFGDAVSLEFAGQTLMLLAHKAVFMPATKTLLVADVHLGKAASFRARHFFAPEGMGEFDLNRLTGLIEQYKIKRLIILGDLIHAKDGLNTPSLTNFDHWRGRHSEVEMILVLGNHDRKLKLGPWRLTIVNDEMSEPPFVFAHVPDYDFDTADAAYESDADTDRTLRIGGHIHPYVSLSGKGRQRERLPCFWWRKDSKNKYSLVLPAFGTFTGSYTIAPGNQDRVFAVAHDTVLEINKARSK